MATINLNAVGITAGIPLFQSLDLVLSDGDRLGLVAGNGGGKTSLLNAIAGRSEPTSGTLTRSRGTSIGVVEQDVPEPLLDRTVRDAVAFGLPAAFADDDWRVDIVLDEFEVPHELRDRTMRQLSGGWRRMVLFARAMIGMPDIVLLDEPTNHLDLTRIIQLERWIGGAAKTMPMIIASHDRRFLDATTNRTLFLRPMESRLYALPFSRARDALNEADTADAERQQKDLKQAKQMRRRAGELYNVGINSGSDLLLTKARQLKSRASAIETTQKALHTHRAGDIRLANSGTHAKVLLTLQAFAAETPDGRKLFTVDKLHLFLGDRAVILGANGTGKTVLMKAMHRALSGDEVAGIRATPSLVVGYADQDMSQLPESETPFDLLSRRFDVPDQRLRDLLAGAGIAVEKQSRPIGALSLGQRSRLGLLALRLSAPNVYLLDEPTNHIDIDGQERLEAEIIDTGASSVLVSHDRAFVEAIATRYFEIKGTRLVEVDGADGFYLTMAR